MEEEIWKSIRNYEQYYEVSSFGNIKSLKRVWSFGRKDETILKPGRRKGYQFVILCVNSIKNNSYVHRIVAEHFCENPYGFNIVNHLDGNILNNKSDNLEWTTSSGNALHAFRIGRRVSLKGGDHGRARINKEQVISLMDARLTGATITELSKLFNISISQVSKIINGQRWSHV